MNLLHITEEVLSLEKELKEKPLLTNKQEVIGELGRLLTNAVDKRTSGKNSIAFSGGVDSTFLAFMCFKLKKPFVLYNVGVKGASDVEWASKIASFYGWKMKQKIYTLEEAEEVFKNVVKIIPDPTVVKVGIATPEYAVLEMAKKDECKILLGGLGSEEIFAGYERHKEAYRQNKVHEECWAGLKKVFESDLLRDLALLNHFQIKMECPFLDKELVSYAMQISPGLKINEQYKKLIFLETALSLGLEKEFVFRPKKAAQYGSGFHSAMEKISKKKGFKLKQDYLNSLK